MAFNAGSKPTYALPKPHVVKTSRPLGKLSVAKPKAGISRPASGGCCGKRA